MVLIVLSFFRPTSTQGSKHLKTFATSVSGPRTKAPLVASDCHQPQNPWNRICSAYFPAKKPVIPYDLGIFLHLSRRSLRLCPSRCSPSPTPYIRKAKSDETSRNAVNCFTDIPDFGEIPNFPGDLPHSSTFCLVRSPPASRKHLRHARLRLAASAARPEAAAAAGHRPEAVGALGEKSSEW